MKKEELARAIFEQRNELYLLTGQTVSDLDSPNAIGSIRDYAGRHKTNELESELKVLTNKIARINHTARVEAYYATPEGAALKADIEAAIESKKALRIAHEADTMQTIDKLLRAALGEHWGVYRISEGNVEIGVINAEKSTPSERRFYVGQTIDIRYEECHWLDKGERFDAGCGGTSGIKLASVTPVGELALFYIGFGQLLGDPELIAILKATIKESAQITSRISAEHKTLCDQLANPFPEAE